MKGSAVVKLLCLADAEVKGKKNNACAVQTRQVDCERSC
jgi:hypothetical protein